MATSGTVGLTTFNTRTLIDNAYRGCKLPAQSVTGEMISIAKEQLYLFLSSLANTGAPLWCITKEILPLYYGTYTVPVPVGTVDILNANLRQLQRLTGTETASEGTAGLAFDGDVETATNQVGAAGWIQTLLDGDGDIVTTVGILPDATGTWDFSLQWSDDGVTWTSFYTDATYAAVDMEWLWLDFEGLSAHAYWRLKANNTTVLNVRELVWANTPQDIMLARINKDDYWNMPNKSFLGRPTEYWYNQKAQEQSTMELWPAPDTESQFRQITLLVHRHIMDVGTLTQTVDVPQRWFEAVVWGLAARLAAITPEVSETATMRAEKNAAEFLRLAWQDQRDNSPIQIMPNISPYTK